jgi:REP element-mobilizing transposase RayT
MAVLTPQQRNTLEAAVKQARKVAELGAFNALHGMAVDHPEPFAHMTPEQRNLRNSLRSKARLLGDALPASGAQKIEHLGYELAYETWHKMLFAKFLEANGLLMHTDGVAVTMEDCEELAKEEGFVDKWDAAANYASKMLPAIFRTDDPLMQVAYATEERIKLETIIDALENQIFMADDALGWVYQFWQSEAKAAINASGAKIDGEKLPAVTQLFTEPYMVHFLIDNTLGAWWVSRNPGIKPPVKFEYLRFANVAPASSRSERGATFFNEYEEVELVKGNLPHWRQEGKIYFVTFRSADSMPQEKLKEWQEELETWKVNNPEPHSQEQKKEYYKRFPAKMQEYLDAGHGACHLKNGKVKSIVENALNFFKGDRYELDEYVVAANHVHVLVTPLFGHQLSDILHSWKSFTANEINKVIGEKGAFWQKESYDHLVRHEASLEKFRAYIRAHDKVAPASSLSNNLRQDGGATLVPAAGKFEGWPDKTAQVTALDPCMGSGHFVASLFPVFAALRMHEEGLTKEQATDKVIAENLHGLELDARCTQIAAFNVALTAWKFCGHYKELPEMNLACSGIAPKGKVEDWVKLVGKVERADDKARLENGMKMLYEHFQLAPELGSLLDPTTIKADAFTASFEELQPVLKRALENEADTEQLERGVMAAGIAKAGQLLSKKYTLQITNVPYLVRGKQDDVLLKFAL